ncbi:hypothetical protein [Paenibacillus odorifer]|nr:hypothetical protein [Paenibacillus odorifer]
MFSNEKPLTPRRLQNNARQFNEEDAVIVLKIIIMNQFIEIKDVDIH